MPKVIPFPTQTEDGDLHQLAHVTIRYDADIIARISDGVRACAIELHSRSPILAQRLVDYADGLDELSTRITENARRAQACGESFLAHRHSMAAEVERLTHKA